MKILSWNINGIRSGWGQVIKLISEENPDILCLQETKIGKKDIVGGFLNPLGYYTYWFPAEKPGYSGVAIFSKCELGSIKMGVGKSAYDREGRFIHARRKEFSIANFYFPHSGRELQRLDFKIGFNRAFLSFARNLTGPVVFCGDFNVAYQEIDLARPKDNWKNAGFTETEREWMGRFLGLGLIDVYRHLYPSKQEFTWWSQRAGVRERNIGWRIDYFLIPGELASVVKDCRILTRVYGSDHCPVVLELKI
ncbi:MAG: exodeoxyribonuclease III [Candidatus Berkelbacteria bacterium]|nr:exodeoxyribonuclease III [Candidatus Berkelbacteria bacterium]